MTDLMDVTPGSGRSRTCICFTTSGIAICSGVTRMTALLALVFFLLAYSELILEQNFSNACLPANSDPSALMSSTTRTESWGKGFVLATGFPTYHSMMPGTS